VARQFTTPVVLPADATSALQAATKQQMDAADALKAPLASPTFTGLVTAVREVRTPQTQSVTTTLAIDASTGDNHQITATGNPAMSVPTNGTNGQMLFVEVLASGGARTVTYNGSIVLSTGLSSTLAIASGKVGLIGMRYSSLAGGVWILLASSQTL